MKRSTNYPIHWFTVFLFTISISWGQIKTSTTLDEAIHKALEKVALYNFDVENFLNSIDVIKEVIKQNT